MDGSDTVRVEVYSDGPWQHADRDRLSARVIHSYGLDEDLSVFVVLANRVSPMREPLAALVGMRQSCPENLSRSSSFRCCSRTPRWRVPRR